MTALSTRLQGRAQLVAVSHSSAEATERWVVQVGGNWDVEVVVDHERELYAQWGLGTSTLWHVLSPRSLYGVWQLGTRDGIWNRPTESGSRWQTAGAFALSPDGRVRWAHVAQAADDPLDLRPALRALGLAPAAAAAAADGGGGGGDDAAAASGHADGEKK
jgi:hypothetical protein